MTRCAGANSLYAESAPDRGDYAPFEASYGQVVQFWGAQCMHHTVPNTTTRTRVSFDFRVVPRSCFQEVAERAEDGQVHTGQHYNPYRPGEFYGEMDASGIVV